MTKSKPDDSDSATASFLEAALFPIDTALLARERERARELRQSAWWRKKIAAGQCHYCGRQVAASDLTMDHVVPLSRGGRSTRGNLVACCKNCNNLKKNLLPVEWSDHLAELRRRFLRGE